MLDSESRGPASLADGDASLVNSGSSVQKNKGARRSKKRCPRSEAAEANHAAKKELYNTTKAAKAAEAAMQYNRAIATKAAMQPPVALVPLPEVAAAPPRPPPPLHRPAALFPSGDHWANDTFQNFPDPSQLPMPPMSILV